LRPHLRAASLPVHGPACRLAAPPSSAERPQLCARPTRAVAAAVWTCSRTVHDRVVRVPDAFTRSCVAGSGWCLQGRMGAGSMNSPHNIAFAQSPPGIGRKRPSLPGQLPGDRASAVPLQLPQMRPVACLRARRERASVSSR
jgi:hypothetical protein